MPHPSPIGKKHEAFELGRESMHPGEIAVRVGAAPKTLIAFSCGELPLLVWNQGSQMSSFKDHSPLRMCTLQNGPWRLGGWGIRMGCMLAVRRSTTNRLVARGYHTLRILRKPLVTANRRRLNLDWARRWKNLTLAARSHVIWGDESRFQLSMATWEFVNCQENASARLPGCQGPSCRGFCPCLRGIPQGCQITPCAPG